MVVLLHNNLFMMVWVTYYFMPLINLLLCQYDVLLQQSGEIRFLHFKWTLL